MIRRLLTSILRPEVLTERLRGALRGTSPEASPRSSRLGQIRPLFISDDEGQTWVVLECAPCALWLEHESHGGWRCEQCGTGLTLEEGYVLLQDARGRLDALLRGIEEYSGKNHNNNEG